MKKYAAVPLPLPHDNQQLSTTSATPVSAADWAAANGCYAPQGGSNLIQDSLSAHGIQVERKTKDGRECGITAGQRTYPDCPHGKGRPYG